MARRSIRGHKSLQWKEKTNEIFDKDSIDFYIDKYLKYMAMQNYSPVTIGTRRRELNYFSAWAKYKNITTLKKVSREFLYKYKTYLYQYRKRNGHPLSFRSQALRLECLRSFFSWLAKKYYIIYNPASELELPKLKQTLPGGILSEKEAERILKQPDINTKIGIRDRTILEVFYSTGMRRLELIYLSIFDFNIDKGTILIKHGKGGKERVVPVGERAISWLRKYLEEVRPSFAKFQDNNYLFITNAGDSLNANYLTRKVTEYKKNAGINKDGSCHIFRHTMATLMLENGADIRYIQQMLGHAKLETTQIYTKVSIKKLKEVHRKTHPTSY